MKYHQYPGIQMFYLTVVVKIILIIAHLTVLQLQESPLGNNALSERLSLFTQFRNGARFFAGTTGLVRGGLRFKKVVPRLRECCRQGWAEVVSTCSNQQNSPNLGTAFYPIPVCKMRRRKKDAVCGCFTISYIPHPAQHFCQALLWLLPNIMC